MTAPEFTCACITRGQEWTSTDGPHAAWCPTQHRPSEPPPEAPTPQEIRDHADRVHPRTNPDGTANAAHVALESTLRERHGHRGYIADLDGPGRFIPGAEPCDHARRSCDEIGCTGDGRRPRSCSCPDDRLPAAGRLKVSSAHQSTCPMRSQRTPTPQGIVTEAVTGTQQWRTTHGDRVVVWQASPLGRVREWRWTISTPDNDALLAETGGFGRRGDARASALRHHPVVAQ